MRAKDGRIELLEGTLDLLTAAGRKQLTVETTRRGQPARALARILRPASEEGRP